MKRTAKFVIMALLQSVRADQPVHCLRESLYGVWDFHVSAQSENVNIFSTQEVCTHKVPNGLQFINNEYKFQFASDQVWRVNLEDDFKVQAMECTNKITTKGAACESKQIVTGKWSPIYSQALLVELDNGKRFITNFRYNIKESMTKNPLSGDLTKLADLSTGSEEAFDSVCDQTMVGYVQEDYTNSRNSGESMKNFHATCFYGVQSQHYDIETTKPVEEGEKKLKFSQIVKHNSNANQLLSLGEPKPAEAAAAGAPAANSTLQVEAQADSTAAEESTVAAKTAGKAKESSGTRKRRSNLHLEHVPSDEMDLLISTINKADLGWKASTCKLQKHHQDYGKGQNCDNDELLMISDDDSSGPIHPENMLAQVSNEQSIGMTLNEFGGKDDKLFKQTLDEAQKWRKNYASPSDIPESAIPEAYDFRNINGYDFTGPVRDQGKCGSCYTVAFVEAVEARLKLKYGKQIPVLSSQQVMQCNFMNEGCEGGWPHMNSYFMERGYMVSDECAPYKAMTKGQSCANYENCQPMAKILNTQYVGKGWGEVTESQILKEMLRNGPVSVEFQANKLFQTYHRGILSEAGITKQTLDLQALGLDDDQSISALSSLINGVFVQTDQSLNDEPTSLEQELSEAAGPKPDDNGKTMTQSSAKSEKAPSEKTMESRGFSWQNQNHSVMLVGWGFDDKTNTKYWIVRNSYNKNWGMNGDFLLRRGQNDFAVEADIVSFEPALCSESKQDECMIL